MPVLSGHEDRTPPEVLRLGEPWQVRVVPNLYPAVDRQEVVVHSPRHVRSIAEPRRRRARRWSARPGRSGPAERAGYVHALVNEGAAAGSSLPHTHSQLVWLAETPPEVAREEAACAGDCPLCLPPDERLVVAERDGVVLSAAWAGRLPYELLVAPAEHEADPWSSSRLAAALALAAEGLRRLHAVEGPRPANLLAARPRPLAPGGACRGSPCRPASSSAPAST